jgi:hypothetical protein
MLLGAASGYTTAYLRYKPIVESHGQQLSDVNARLSSLEQDISSKESRIATQEVHITNLQSDKVSLYTEMSAARLQADNYRMQLHDLESQLETTNSRLDSIMDITVTQYYEWTYRSEQWQWELPIPLSVYIEYLEKPRPPVIKDYVHMARDLNDDHYIDMIVSQTNVVSLTRDFTDRRKIGYVVAFVQNLTYLVDETTKSSYEYPKYPIETLFDRGGDCEDTSILLAAILDRLGYDVALLYLPNARHVAVGIFIPKAYGAFYEYDGKKYYYIDTAYGAYRIGKIPPEITDKSAQVYPLAHE